MDIAREFLNQVNGAGMRDQVEFAKEFCDGHRTLQQKGVGFMLQCLVQMAENADSGWVDARNEYAAEIARDVRDLLKKREALWEGKVNLPLI